MKNKKILGHDSKEKLERVKNKNIKNFKGKPLAKWTLEVCEKIKIS